MIRNIFFIVAMITIVGIVALNAQDKTKKEEPKKMENQTEGKKPVPKELEVVVMETSMGTIELQMFRGDAPKTVENFVQLAKKGYYNGIIFHRVIDQFMIQGGDPTGTGMGGESIYGKKFEDEFSPKYTFDKKGLLAMANAGPGTNGSQFFITLVPTPHLNNRHTIFGQVIAGMDVVEAIGKVKTSQQGNKPITPVVMKNVYVKGEKKEEPKK